MLLDSGVGVMPKVIEVYIDKATLPTDPTRGRTDQPPRASAQCGGIVAKYAYGCCSVAPEM